MGPVPSQEKEEMPDIYFPLLSHTHSLSLHMRREKAM